jgi:hypothetical protein
MRNTYTVNDKFFSDWSPEMAYVLGFIYADGNMSRESYKIRIDSKDYQVLDDIRKSMESDLPIKECHKGEFTWYELTLNKKQIYSDLRKLGVFPNKSLTMRMPEVPKEMMPHFIRGYFDGDGCVYEVKRKRPTPGLEIDFATGSKDFADAVYKYLIENVHSTFRIAEKRKNYYSIRGYNQASEAIFTHMYDSATIYMKRKHNKFIEIMNKRHSNLG